MGVLVADPAYASFYTNSSNGPTILINGHLISDVVLSDEFSCAYNLRFDNCEFQGNFRITAGVFKNIELMGCSLHKQQSFVIMNGTFAKIMFHSDNVFEGSISFHGGRFADVSVSGGNYNHRILFSNGSFQRVHIGTCDISSVGFMSGVFDVVQISGLNTSSLSFSDGLYRSIAIYGLSKISVVNFNNGVINSLLFHAPNVEKIENHISGIGTGLFIKKLTLKQMGVFDGLFVGIPIETIEFQPSYLKSSTSLRFQNIRASNVNFNGFVNLGQLAFSVLTLKNQLSVIDSDLGKASFINSNIKNISLALENSKITDVFFSDTSFPDKVSQNDHQQRLTYAQLKKINESKGDYLEANRFYALEMNAYYNTITWNEKTFWEKFNLFLNKYSNNHGQNWALGLGSSLLIGMIFYMFYLVSFGGWTYNFCSSSHWVSAIGNASYFLEFVNPIHKTDAIAEYLDLKPNKTSRFIETASRIVIAYTVYQMIQAFRKHAKK